MSLGSSLFGHNFILLRNYILNIFIQGLGLPSYLALRHNDVLCNCLGLSVRTLLHSKRLHRVSLLLLLRLPTNHFPSATLYLTLRFLKSFFLGSLPPTFFEVFKAHNSSLILFIC